MSRSIHGDIVDALHRLRTGAAVLTSEEYVKLLDAIEHVSGVLQMAPRGSDTVANGVWYHHERSPALAKLADALPTPHRRTAEPSGAHPSASAQSAQAQHANQLSDDAIAIRALQDSLRNG